MHGELRFREAAAALKKLVADAMGHGVPSSGIERLPNSEALPGRMEDALRRFQGRVLLILSGNDLTAQEFKDAVARSRRWQVLLSDERVTRHDLPEANHTFSRREWRDQVARWTEAWVKSF